VAQQPAPDVPVFRSQSHLVLLPFRVARGKNYVTNLKPSDVTLLEDGQPREFTIFRFTRVARPPSHRTRSLVRHESGDPAALGPARRFPVYSPVERQPLPSRLAAGDGQGSGRTPHLCLPLLRRTVVPVFARDQRPTGTHECSANTARAVTRLARGGERYRIESSAGRERVGPGRYTNDYVTSPFLRGEYRSWPMEAAIGLLNEVSAAQDRIARIWSCSLRVSGPPPRSRRISAIRRSISESRCIPSPRTTSIASGDFLSPQLLPHA